MGIEKRNRVYTEQSTSINQDIMKSQKGIISFVPQATTGLIIGIPTTIEDPRFLSLLPMSAVTAGALNANAAGSGSPWYCDLALYNASDVSSAFASIGSNVVAAEIGRRVRISGAVDGFNLYVAQVAMSSNYGASKHTRLASTAYWKKDDRFNTNAKKYLKVTTNLYASVLLHAKKQTLAYEVQGY